jgi:hypothetical protein
VPPSYKLYISKQLIKRASQGNEAAGSEVQDETGNRYPGLLTVHPALPLSEYCVLVTRTDNGELLTAMKFIFS